MGTPQEGAADENHQHAVRHREEAVPLEEQQPFEVAAQVEDERVEELRHREPRQQAELVASVSQQGSHGEGHQQVEPQQAHLETQDATQVLGDELRMLRDVAGVEVGDPQVEQYIEDIGQVEDREVEAVHLVAHGVLHAHLDAEYPQRLDNEVGQQYPEQARE